MIGLVLLAAVAFVVAIMYGAYLLDQWEEERELRWRFEDTMRRAQESLGEPLLFDQEVA